VSIDDAFNAGSERRGSPWLLGLSHDGPRNDKFESQVVYPGGTIVIPEQLNKTTLLRGLTDWSAVFSQFVLGAAAINVLK